MRDMTIEYGPTVIKVLSLVVAALVVALAVTGGH